MMIAPDVFAAHYIFVYSLVSYNKKEGFYTQMAATLARGISSELNDN